MFFVVLKLRFGFTIVCSAPVPSPTTTRRYLLAAAQNYA
jgi:hypothetical protein